MTKYEYCLICYERYKALGDGDMAGAYRRLIDEMTVGEAEKKL